MDKQTILITGASGFIGQLLCRRLAENSQYHVVALDRVHVLKSDQTSTIRSGNVQAIKSGQAPASKTLCTPAMNITTNGSLVLENADITDPNAVSTICNTHCPDVIIHCAGIAHQKINSISPDLYFKINSQATKALAKAAFFANPHVHFIFLSSISVYGEHPEKGYWSEQDTCHPSSDYAASKREAEQHLIDLHNANQLNALDILRLSPVYDFTWSLNLDRRVFAPKKWCYLKFGSGEQKMSAISRQNLVDFIEFCINKTDSSQSIFCHLMNLSDATPYSFKKIIDIFKQSPHHPNRWTINIPLPLIWMATRLAGRIFADNRQWWHACYNKLADDLMVDNKRMLETGFTPKQNLTSVFLKEYSK